MSDNREEAIANADRQTPDVCARACRNAAIRTGKVLVETILLHDGDPAEYRELMIASFDAEVEARA